MLFLDILYDYLTFNFCYMLLFLFVISILKKAQEIMLISQWRITKDVEMDLLKPGCNWELVPSPRVVRLTACWWVFFINYNLMGS